MNPSSHLIKRYCAALGIMLLAFLGYLGLDALVGGELPVFITFYPCVMVVALLAGSGPGLAAVASATLLCGVWILAPAGQLAVDSLRDLVALAVFAGMGILICLATEIYRRGRGQDAPYPADRHPDPDLPAPPAGTGARRVLLAAGMLASLAVMLTVFLHVQFHLSAVGKSDAEVSQSRSTIGRLDRLLTQLKDAETGECGYLITGSPAYLDPYRAAVGGVTALLAELSAVEKGTPRQAQMTRLAELTREKLRDLEATLELRRSRGGPAALAAEGAGRGTVLMERIGALASGLQADQRRLLERRISLRVQQRQEADQAVRDGGLLSLLLLGTVYLFLIQENRLRRRAQAGLFRYQAHLREMVERRTAELADANRDLELEVAGHRQAREELGRSHRILEERVAERTAELESRNAQLVWAAAERRKAEEELSRSELRYRDIMENHSEYVTGFLPGGVLTYVNLALSRVLDQTPEQLLGTSFYPLIHEDYREQVVRSIEALSVANPTNVIEDQLMYADGLHWQQWKNRALFDCQGNVVEYQATGRDITEQRLTELALRESEERYRAVVEDQTDLIARYQPNGTYTFVNEAFCRFYGKSYHELVGKEWYPDVITDDFPDIVDQLQLLAPDNPLVTVECRLISRDGVGHWIQFVNHGFFDAQGRLVETQAVGRDITARKQLEETLRVSESKFRIIFENAIYGILIFDYDSGLILDANETVVSMYGYSREELLCTGMSAYDLSTAPEESRATAREVSKKETTFHPLKQHRKKDGSVFPVEVVAGAYLWNGRRVMFTLLHDIWERKRAEETLERYSRRLIVLEEDLRKRIAMELHDDIGQVLTGLSFNLAHIQADLPQDCPEKLRLVLADSRMLTKEISRKVRNLMVDLRPTQLEEYGLAAAIRHHAEQYSQRTGIPVSVLADPSVPRLPVKQELALFRITQEALNNVVKHALASAVSVRLESDGAQVLLAIRDDGRGFVPGDAAPLPGGSGWGLTIMRERAELAGGTFLIETAPGEGTLISVAVLEEVGNVC
jgi:PAS domain S-box-containing protein